MERMKNIAVIFAGGTGERMEGRSVPKQFLTVQDGRRYGYPEPVFLNMDTSRLRALGWSPGGMGGYDPLIWMYWRMVQEGSSPTERSIQEGTQR